MGRPNSGECSGSSSIAGSNSRVAWQVKQTKIQANIQNRHERMSQYDSSYSNTYWLCVSWKQTNKQTNMHACMHTYMQTYIGFDCFHSLNSTAFHQSPGLAKLPQASTLWQSPKMARQKDKDDWLTWIYPWKYIQTGPTPVLIVFSKKVELFVCNGSLLRLHYGCTTTAKLSSLSSLETWKLLLFRKFSKIRSGSFCIWMPPRLESPSWFQSWPSNTGSEKMANHMSHDT